jgi:hypothetical protein
MCGVRRQEGSGGDRYNVNEDIPTRTGSFCVMRNGEMRPAHRIHLRDPELCKVVNVRICNDKRSSLVERR